MNLIALGLGLLLEKLLTRWLHLREPHWFDGYFDWMLRHLNKLDGFVAILGAAVAALLPVLPVLLIAHLFRDTLLGIPYLVFAALVLLFSLGPRDLGDEVDDYCTALDAGEDERAEAVAREIIEADAPDNHPQRIHALRKAIFIQANNRLFGVIFWFLSFGLVGAWLFNITDFRWFLALGPAGAWLFRITDLMRRHTVFRLAQSEAGGGRLQASFARAVFRCHGALAWPSARLLAIGYALAGSFEDAVSDWRAYYQNTAEHFFEVSNDILATAGCGAQGVAPSGEDLSADGVCELESAAARNAMALVRRTLVVWITFIALATLLGWTV